VLTSAKFSFTGEAGGNWYCAVDGGSWQFCTSPLELTGLSAGDHTVSVKQQDDLGNTGEPTVYNWSVAVPTSQVAPVVKSVKVNRSPKTKVTTLAIAPAPGDSILKIEYWNHTKRPKDSAPANKGFVRAWAPVIKLNPGQVAFWIRVKGSNGVWSGWTRTRQKASGFGW